MTGQDPRSPATPEVRDARVAPSGVVPRNTQALVLTGLALVMVLVIALSGHNAPKEKSGGKVTAAAPVDTSAAQIEAYETQLKAETQRLQAAKDQLAHTQQALGLTSPSGTAPMGGFSEGAVRPSVPQSLAAPQAGELDAAKRELSSLFASNVALTYRSEPPSAPPAASPLSPADAVAKALANYSPAPGGAGAATNATPTAPSDPAVHPADDRKPDAQARAAQRDAELDHAAGPQYRLFEGTVLETVLTNRLDGSFSGPVNCMVTASVYSRNGRHVLIPQGSRVLGEARKVETFGDTRLAVAFHRLIMPDGYSVSLDQFHGLNQIGETGLQDQINHHYLQVFGVSLAIGAVAGFSQANTSYGVNESAADAYRQGAAASLSQSSMHVLDRYLNVLPTITIREGHRVRVYLSDDLLLPAYEKHQMPEDL